MKIVFDVDDILWGLNDKICEQNNIDIEKLHSYRISTIDELTSTEKALITKGHNDPNTFKDIGWYDGIEKLVGKDIYINSNCCNEEIADLKYTQIKETLGLDDSHIKMNVLNSNPISEESV